jgi:parallel beta-helix repeat protein
MNDAARQALVKIVARHGRSLAGDPRRCEALLRDYCGQYKREINVLVGALKEQVAADMINSSAAMPVEVLYARLGKRLQDDLGFSEEASKWAVESWAQALNLATPEEREGDSHKSASPPAAATSAINSTDPDDPFAHDTPAGPAASSPEDILRQALRIVFADDIATEYEKADLQRIRQRLGLPIEAASRIFAEVKEERRQSKRTTPAARLPAKTIVVSQERGAQYGSIGEAIHSADPGTHILVRPGLYRESMVIDKSVGISGDGPVENVIVESTDAPCLITRAARINVHGLTLRSLVRGDRKDYFAVDIGYGGLVLEDCDVTTDASACISIHGPGTSPTIRRCRVHNGGNYGIWVWDDAGANIEDCQVSHCGGAGIIISGDTMSEAREMAASILADLSDDQRTIAPSLNANSVNLTPGPAASIPVLRRCDIFGGQDHGIWVHYKGRALVEHCHIRQNALAGVWIDQHSEAALRHCMINRNEWEAVRVTDNSSATVEDCNLTENRKGAWAVERGCQLRQSSNRT